MTRINATDIAAAMGSPQRTLSSSSPTNSVNCECGGIGIVSDGNGTIRPCPICGTIRPWLPNGSYERMTFATFKRRSDASAAEQRALMAAAQQALAFVDDSHVILTLIGPNGTGKSHLAVAIGHEMAARKRQPTFWEVANLLDALRPNGDDSLISPLERCQRADLLILDDLGAEQATAWVDEKLFQIINWRYTRQRKTVITSNLLPKDMPQRIASRLADGRDCRLLVMAAPDIRPVLHRFDP